MRVDGGFLRIEEAASIQRRANDLVISAPVNSLVPLLPVMLKLLTRANSAELLTPTTCSSEKSFMFWTRFTSPSQSYGTNGEQARCIWRGRANDHC